MFPMLCFFRDSEFGHSLMLFYLALSSAIVLCPQTRRFEGIEKQLF